MTEMTDMPSEEWLNFAIAMAKENAEEFQLAITYPFEVNEVDRIYTEAYYDGGGGDGLWFLLRNGVIYDIMSNRISRRGSSFKRPIKGSAAVRTAVYVVERLNGWKPREYGHAAV